MAAAIVATLKLETQRPPIYSYYFPVFFFIEFEMNSIESMMAKCESKTTAVAGGGGERVREAHCEAEAECKQTNCLFPFHLPC